VFVVAKKRVTFFVDTKVYDLFKKYCEENGFILSKRVENLLKYEVARGGKNE